MTKKMCCCKECGVVVMIEDIKAETCEMIDEVTVDDGVSTSLTVCGGEFELCDEFITSKEIIDHVSQLQVKCSVLLANNEDLQVQKDAFHDALVTTQKELKDLKEEQRNP